MDEKPHICLSEEIFFRDKSSLISGFNITDKDNETSKLSFLNTTYETSKIFIII